MLSFVRNCQTIFQNGCTILYSHQQWIEFLLPLIFSSIWCCQRSRLWPFKSWTIKKAGHQGTDAFELWCWRRLLRVSWTARRSNQSILKEIRPEYSLEGLMLKLKLQYFGYLPRRTDSLEKILMLGKRLKARGEGDDRGWDGWMTSPTRWTWVWVSSGSW